jgi:hypothetical protein
MISLIGASLISLIALGGGFVGQGDFILGFSLVAIASVLMGILFAAIANGDTHYAYKVAGGGQLNVEVLRGVTKSIDPTTPHLHR